MSTETNRTATFRGQLGYLEFVPEDSLIHVDYERNLLAFQEISLRLAAEVAEIRRLQEQPQEIRPLGQVLVALASEEAVEASLVFSPCHRFDATGEVRLKLYPEHSHGDCKDVSNPALYGAKIASTAARRPLVVWIMITMGRMAYAF